jgi:hypothetical protein
MPWSVEDVDKHKKGLNDEQKKRWVDIANSALKSCMSKGGSEGECAASAIRQANGVVGHNENEHYSVHVSKQEAGFTIKEQVHQGRAHIVVPVVMMVEGVHHGSHGPMLHLIDDLGRFPESWNGIPVVIDHPEVDGMNVSANSPDIIEEQTVGRVYNTHVDGGRLMAEAWLDSERLRQLSVKVLENLRKGIPLEVSLGMFTEDEAVAGDWHGEAYQAIAKGHRPDHLALLPDSIGACSLKDGCGLGVNEENKDIQGANNDGGNVDGSSAVDNSSINNKRKVTEMADNAIKCSPCVEKKANDLIAHAGTQFTDADREWLHSLDETLLDKLFPVVQQVDSAKLEVTAEQAMEVLKSKLSKPEDFIQLLPKEIQEQVNAGLKTHRETRDKMVQSILANTAKGVWEETDLKDMNFETLKKVHESTRKEPPVDYSANAGGDLNANATKEAPMAPTGVIFKTEKK